MFEDRLPYSAFDMPDRYTSTTSITIRIEARYARFFDGAPSRGPINAWRYVRVGGPEDDSQALDVNLGPILQVKRGTRLDVIWENHLGSMASTTGGGATLEMPPINPVPMDFPSDMWTKMIRPSASSRICTAPRFFLIPTAGR